MAAGGSSIPLRLLAVAAVAAGLAQAASLAADALTEAKERAAMRKLAPHILVTTPESLYVLMGSASGREGLAKAIAGGYDLITLDRMLPEVDGLTIVTTLRNLKIATPILMISALSDVDERVRGLRADGAVLELEASISQITVRGRKLLTAILRDVTERVRAEQALAQYQTELSELTQQLLHQEQITTRELAQTLHDQLGQTLGAIRLSFDSLAQMTRELLPPRAQERSDTVGRQIDHAIAEVRQALVRRAQGRQVQGTLAWEDLQVDTRSPRAWRQDLTINLTPTTHKLLMCLVRAAPAVVRKQEMEYLVWGDEPPDSGALRTHIHELRLQVDRSFDTALITTAVRPRPPSSDSARAGPRPPVRKMVNSEVWAMRASARMAPISKAMGKRL